MRVPLSAERWKALEPLIDAAVELSPDRRRAFVRDSCGGDAALEAELEQLLAEYDRVDEQFEVAAVERFPSLIDDSSILNAILNERYRIERELGRGGMATVYLARDLRHERDVAVKVLHPDLAAALGGRRFLAEIKTTARLQHPHILALHDSGEADGFLFYVMPYVEGQSLRSRLERERQLPIDEVVRIASEVASALDAAHAAGVIHRDIKPENILLHNGSALVADFGIAIAASDAAPRITKSGLALGTPQYMSPEQGTGSGRVDARTDVYALGTMVFEMLAGEAPFTGATSSAILAKRAAMAAPPVKVLRAAVPVEMDAAVAKALSREPVDRYATAGEFAEGLRGAVGGVPVSRSSTTPRARGNSLTRRWTIAGVAASIIAVVATIVMDRSARGVHADRMTILLQDLGIVSRALDTSTYVVVADDVSGSAGGQANVAESMRNALRRWRELTVADPVSASGELAPQNTSPGRKARAIATSLGAGRYVRVVALTTRDSIDVIAALFDTRSDARLSDGTVRAAPRGPSVDSAVERLASELVIRGVVPTVARPEGLGRTHSLAARQAFVSGQAALEAGNFGLADSQFFVATQRDPEFAQALVWLANVRNWRNSSDSPWSQLVQQAIQAVAERGGLAPGDSILFEALRAQAGGHTELACSVWRRLTQFEPYDYAAWYGFGTCLRRDSVVVRDPQSHSGWRFRSSYEAALRAYEQAFRYRPALLSAFGGPSLRDLELLLYTGTGRRRPGAAFTPNPRQFQGIPVWYEDSLTFLPVLIEEAVVAEGAKNSLVPSEAVDAVRHERDRFLAIARIWRSQFPQSAQAAEAVGVALEMLGNPAAIDTLQVAQRLATDSSDELRIAASEVLVRIKFSLPHDAVGLRKAVVLADSLFESHPPTEHRESRLLASLAALGGRAELAASYAATAPSSARPQISQIGPELLAFAALGGPRDTLALIESLVENAIASLAEPQRSEERTRWILRAATIAYPDFQSSSLVTARTSLLRQARLVAAAVARDSGAVRKTLAEIAESRRWLRPSDVTMDAVLAEANALNAIGDARGAIDWLDPPLRSIRLTPSQDLADAARTGPLVRAMVLRAELAGRVGDSLAAREWARAVVILWSGADAFLTPTRTKMKLLAR